MLVMTLSASDGPLTEQLPPTDSKSIPLTVSAFVQLHNHNHSGTIEPLNLHSIPLFQMTASKSGAQEITVRGSESSYCFDGLTPDTLYNATVYTQTPNLEGPGVSVKERTCMKTFSFTTEVIGKIFCH